MKSIALSTALLLLCAALAAQQISPQGEALGKAYDAMDVESLWLSGSKAVWDTGKPLPGSPPGKTHCSAFAAAACKRLGVYLLRPPEHLQNGLANAQFDWLSGEGAKQGWRKESSMESAQKLANEGWIVAAVWRSPDASRSGHIALIRPSEKSGEALAKEGPDIIQAGGRNFNKTSLKQGFKAHKGAFEGGEIAFFSHEVSQQN